MRRMPPSKRRYAGCVLLSDRDIRAELDRGRIRLEPYDPAMIQPSTIDVRLDRYFRLFDNHKYPFIDPAEDQPELTRLVEVRPDEPFILHPGEFVLGSTYEAVTLPDDVAARLEGKSLARPARPADPLDRRVHRPRVHGPRHARAVERRHAADQALAGHEDRPAVLLPPLVAERAPLRLGRVRQPLPGPARPDGVAFVPELPPHRRRRDRGRVGRSLSGGCDSG